MFWNDIKAIREWMADISLRMANIENKQDYICQVTEDNYARMMDNLKRVVEEVEGIQDSYMKEGTIEKFEDYMKNVDKLHTLVNEFKGCVSIARAAIEERKELDKVTQESKNIAVISREIYKGMINFIEMGKSIKQEAHEKINAIYKAVCESKEKKSRKVAKPKKASPGA